MHPPVQAAGPAAARWCVPRCDHPAMVQHDDLVHLVQPVQVVRDQQGGAARGGGQQVGGERARRLSGSRCAVGSSRISSGRVGQQRPGQREPLPFPAGHGRAARADQGVPARAAASWIQGSSRARAAARGQLVVAGARPGQPEVVARSWCRRCAGPAGSRRSPCARRRRRSWPGRPPPRVAVPPARSQNRSSTAATVDLPAPLGPTSATRRPGAQVEVDPVQGQRRRRLRTGPGRRAAAPAPARRAAAAARPGSRTGSGASRTAADPARRWPGPGRAGWPPRAGRSPPRTRPAR